MDWSDVVLVIFGGGALITLITALLTHQHERNANLRAAKVESITQYIESSFAARASLSDLEDEVLTRDWDQPAEPSIEHEASGTDDVERAELPFGVRRSAHTSFDDDDYYEPPGPGSTRRRLIGQIRQCRLDAARMFLMLPPKPGVRPLVDEIVGGLYEAEAILDDLEGSRRAGAPQADVAAAAQRLKDSLERRHVKEAQLLFVVHSELWRSPWRAAGARAVSSPSAAEEVIFSADLPPEGRRFTLVAGSRVARPESRRAEMRPRDIEGANDDGLND